MQSSLENKAAFLRHLQKNFKSFRLLSTLQNLMHKTHRSSHGLYSPEHKINKSTNYISVSNHN